MSVGAYQTLLGVNSGDVIGDYGESALAAGSAVVPTAALSAFSTVMVSYATISGTPGFLSVPSASRILGSAGGFTVTSTSALDASTFGWIVVG